MAEPKLPNLKGTKREIKSYIKGIQDEKRNDLSKPYGGIRKVSNPRNRVAPSANEERTV